MIERGVEGFVKVSLNVVLRLRFVLYVVRRLLVLLVLWYLLVQMSRMGSAGRTCLPVAVPYCHAVDDVLPLRPLQRTAVRAARVSVRRLRLLDLLLAVAVHHPGRRLSAAAPAVSRTTSHVTCTYVPRAFISYAST
jgi:hypothetical protein